MMRRGLGLLVSAVLLAGCSSPASDEGQDVAEEAAEPTSSSVLDWELGACVNDADTPLGADLADVPRVPCTEPHDSELFAIVTVEGDSYPGADLLIDQGQTSCQEQFGEFVGIDFRSSLLDFHFYYPTPSSWSEGDRTIYCMVFDPGLQVQGTLEDAKR